MRDGIVYLDPAADSGMIASMTEETAEELGWSLNGASIENDDGFCYAIVGMPWDDEESDEANDAQADRDWRATTKEIERAGLEWEEE